MNLEDFQAQFDHIIEEMRKSVEPCYEYYCVFDKGVEELYNLCLKALGEI